MKEIRHSFLFNISTEKLFDALSTGEGISNWWTTDARLEQEEGAKGEFQWAGHNWKVNITLQKIKKNELITWFCDESNMQDTDAWKDTTIEFKLTQNENGTCRLDFCQSNYKESPCYTVCTDGWRFVLGESLKAYLETGSGKPYQSEHPTK